jgi:hypothetical protein
MRIVGMDSDTGLWRMTDEPTHILDLVSGQHLRIIAGPLTGLKGTIVARRQGGVLLIRTGSGTYVEVCEFCVTPEKREHFDSP